MNGCGNCGGSMAGRRSHALYCSRECQVEGYHRNGAKGHGPTQPERSQVPLTVRVPRATLSTIDDLACESGVDRRDWLLRAIGDAILDQTGVLS